MNTKEKIAKFNELLSDLDVLDEEGEEGRELYKAITIRKNRENIYKFSLVPFSKRVIVLPQCLRNIKVCKAYEDEFGLHCGGCGGCKIGVIAAEAKKLNYMDVLILRGGSILKKVLTQRKPEAVLGVACHYESAIGLIKCEKYGASVQACVLTRDGCVNTDVDLEEMLELMRFVNPVGGAEEPETRDLEPVRKLALSARK